MDCRPDLPSPFLAPADCEQPYTITQINNGVAEIVERGNAAVWFVGEISNYKRHTSGHCYLKLKDAESQVPAVIWNSTAGRLGFEPEDGMEVSGIAAIRVYRKGGYYQLDIRRMQPSGLGKLYAAFEALKKKLEQEGLFDEARKRPIPRSVTRLGVVTARSGAAVKDIIRVVATRSPRTDIVLCNVRVQGDGAAADIARAIRRMNEYGQVDCMIVGRGGGSIEDLWAFNEEPVARAIFASQIPVISAVGHETDFTIADFVADARAATPSAAAEMAVADEEENKRLFVSLARRVTGAFLGAFRAKRDSLSMAMRSPGMRDVARRVAEGRQQLDGLREVSLKSMATVLRERATSLTSAAAHLEALSPLAVLSRGYSVVSKPDGAVVRSSLSLTPGETVKMRFSEGGAEATVQSVEATREA
jgi:exodeoxyribonuclease VII large subunit